MPRAVEECWVERLTHSPRSDTREPTKTRRVVVHRKRGEHAFGLMSHPPFREHFPTYDELRPGHPTRQERPVPTTYAWRNRKGKDGAESTLLFKKPSPVRHEQPDFPKDRTDGQKATPAEVLLSPVARSS